MKVFFIDHQDIAVKFLQEESKKIDVICHKKLTIFMKNTKEMDVSTKIIPKTYKTLFKHYCNKFRQ